MRILLVVGLCLDLGNFQTLIWKDSVSPEGQPRAIMIGSNTMGKNCQQRYLSNRICPYCRSD